MMDEIQTPKIDIPFTFKRKPEPLPPNLRPDWKISIILLILHYSKGYKASFEKIHVLNWAIQTSERRKLLMEYNDESGKGDEIIIRVEASLARALDFARVENLIKINKGKRVMLTKHGKAIAKKIDNMNSSFIEEREFLQGMKPKVKEKDITALLRWENI